MNYVEEKGFGMKTFKSLHKKYGMSIPQFKYKEPFLTLTFARTTQGLKSLIKNAKNLNISDEELKLFEIFREKRPVSKSDFVSYSGLASRTAERYLQEWTENKMLTKIGSGPITKYIINE